MSNDTDEALGCLIWILIALGLLLLFGGDPDVWDVLHAKIMRELAP